MKISKTKNRSAKKWRTEWKDKKEEKNGEAGEKMEHPKVREVKSGISREKSRTKEGVKQMDEMRGGIEERKWRGGK